ncbi:hypothetical protein TDB9533_04323 [Thalassocella blandensis]|nr:hypothetical protein TDB9533_04323 [Thalassocella blandensis]
MKTIIAVGCMTVCFIAGIETNERLFKASPSLQNAIASTQTDPHCESLNSQKITAALNDTLRQTIRDGLREEAVAIMLEASFNSHQNNTSGLVTDVERSSNSSSTLSHAQLEQQRMAAENFQQLVKTSINTAQWSEKDNNELRHLLGTVDRETEMQMMTQLAAAINRGELNIQFDGPLF